VMIVDLRFKSWPRNHIEEAPARALFRSAKFGARRSKIAQTGIWRRHARRRLRFVVAEGHSARCLSLSSAPSGIRLRYGHESDGPWDYVVLRLWRATATAMLDPRTQYIKASQRSFIYIADVRPIFSSAPLAGRDTVE